MKSDASSSMLLVDAASWRLLGLLFERPRPGWLAEVLALAAEVEDPRFVSAARTAHEANEGSYLAVLGPGGPVSPREVAYRPLGDPGKILAELGLFYEAFGFRPDAEDPPDHVSVETGFVGFLKLKLAYAEAREDDANQRSVQRAIDIFLREHLGSFAEDLARGLRQAAPPHLELASSILEESCPRPARPENPLNLAGNSGLTSIGDQDDESCGGLP